MNDQYQYKIMIASKLPNRSKTETLSQTHDFVLSLSPKRGNVPRLHKNYKRKKEAGHRTKVDEGDAEANQSPG